MDIIEDVHNALNKTMQFCNKGVVQADPPPQLWPNTTFSLSFETLPLAK